MESAATVLAGVTNTTDSSASTSTWDSMSALRFALVAAVVLAIVVFAQLIRCCCRCVSDRPTHLHVFLQTTATGTALRRAVGEAATTRNGACVLRINHNPENSKQAASVTN